MDSEQSRANLQALVGVGAIVAVDQLSKLIMTVYLADKPQRSISLWGEYLKLILDHNPGGAFGILPEKGVMLTVFTVAVASAIVIVLWRGDLQSTRILMGLTAIAGGAIGNLIDRLRLGYVVDFLSVGISPVIRWPTFNLADSAIVIGATLLLWHLLMREVRA